MTVQIDRYYVDPTHLDGDFYLKTPVGTPVGDETIIRRMRIGQKSVVIVRRNSEQINPGHTHMTDYSVVIIDASRPGLTMSELCIFSGLDLSQKVGVYRSTLAGATYREIHRNLCLNTLPCV